MSGYGTSYIVFLTAFAAIVVSAQNQASNDPFEMSLVKPFQPENWIKLGNPLFDQNSAVLTTRKRPGPQRAALWNPNPFVYRQGFNITLRTKITAASGPKTGKGLGLWLLEKPDDAPIGELGPVYGSRDYFRGLGIVLDTIDDDKRRNNPSISAHYLNGTVPYSHADDGVKTQLAGCVADYRRAEVVATRVAYNGTTLTVHVDLGGNNRFQKCLEVPLTMRTDRDWYMGVSAETIASEYPQETHEVVAIEVTGVPDWNAKRPQQKQQQQVPPQQQSWQQQQQPPQQSWPQPPQEPATGDATETLHDKIDQLMKATTHTALESQQAGEALKEVQTNVLQKIHQSTNSIGQQIRRVDQSLAQHVSSTASQLQSLVKTIESTKASVDSGRVDNERRANTVDTQIAALQDTIKGMNVVVDRLSKSFQAQISREIGKGTARMAAAASKGGDWNIWLFIILFQVVFIGFLLYRSMMNRKLDKLL